MDAAAGNRFPRHVAVGTRCSGNACTQRVRSAQRSLIAIDAQERGRSPATDVRLWKCLNEFGFGAGARAGE